MHNKLNKYKKKTEQVKCLLSLFFSSDLALQMTCGEREHEEDQNGQNIMLKRYRSLNFKNFFICIFYLFIYLRAKKLIERGFNSWLTDKYYMAYKPNHTFMYLIYIH